MDAALLCGISAAVAADLGPCTPFGVGNAHAAPRRLAFAAVGGIDAVEEVVGGPGCGQVR